MKYLLAVILPPLAVLLCKKPVQAIINFFLIFLFWIPAVIHAMFVVNGYESDRRTKEIVSAINKSGEDEQKRTQEIVSAINKSGEDEQ